MSGRGGHLYAISIADENVVRDPRLTSHGRMLNDKLVFVVGETVYPYLDLKQSVVAEAG